MQRPLTEMEKFVIENKGTERPFSGKFNDFFDNNWMMKANSTAPAINVIENEKGYKVELAAPGMVKDDFKITLNPDNELVIEMEKKSETKEEDMPNNQMPHNLEAEAALPSAPSAPPRARSAPDRAAATTTAASRTRDPSHSPHFIHRAPIRDEIRGMGRFGSSNPSHSLDFIHISGLDRPIRSISSTERRFGMK